MEELNEALEHVDDPENEEHRRKLEYFRIENDGQATWAMKKLRDVLKKQEEQLAIAQQEMALVQQWMDDIKRKHEWSIRYFEGVLGDYARRQREEGVKTVTTPYGKVGTRISEVKIACSNPEEFIAWASENLPNGVRVKREVAVSALKELIKSGALNAVTETQQLLTAEGEVIPAIMVVPPQVVISISTEK